jgi:acetyl/propionyl-CoA carboxylase alpha subunit
VTATPIHTLLVANRGEIAARIIDAAHEMGMRAIGVYSEADRATPHVTSADAAVALGGVTATESYLDQRKILDAAARSGADAIHPGYGFLSENAEFARAVADAGLTWVGPHPDAIARMGDKLAAKRLASALGLPLLPSVELVGDAPFEWRAQVGAVGYPLLVKAAAGGGGRGMRLVMSEDDLDQAVASARREAAASFGDGTVFAERWLAAPRHVEIQVIADRHGHVMHLGERECSIQRRHQKLIEEAPSPAVDDLLRERMGTAAVRLAEEIAYDSVGTVEFLLDTDGDEFFFLEMNTRLQVEHRVTERVTGFDLVDLQLRAAMGEEFDFEQGEIDVEGHAIEARLVAEDPAEDWRPATGELHRFLDLDDDSVLWDAGYRAWNKVTPHYDSLLAKVIAHGTDRREATRLLQRALERAPIHGVRTNRDHLVAVLDSEDFRAGNTTTAFVDLHLTLLDTRPAQPVVDRHALAATMWAQLHRRDPHWPAAPSGWRNVGPRRQTVTYLARGSEVTVGYTIEATGSFRATIDDRAYSGDWLAINEDDGDAVLLEVDGVAAVHRVHHVGYTWYVNSPDGQSELVEAPRFPIPQAAASAGGLVAPVPGRVVAVEVTAGDVVTSGQTLVVMEAMKVEHRITAPGDGKVLELLVAIGDNVDAHQVLLQMDLT